MRIDEVDINQEDRLFETIIDRIANETIIIHDNIKASTNNFTIHAQDVYSIDEIADFIWFLKNEKQRIDKLVSLDQTNKIIDFLISYLNS